MAPISTAIDVRTAVLRRLACAYMGSPFAAWGTETHLYEELLTPA